MEIKNKEKSLVELMGRILKEPLNPLERSLKVLVDDNLDIKDLISEVNDALGASALDAEKTRKTLQKIQEGFPTLGSTLQTYILSKFEVESQKIVAALDKSVNQHDENLKAVSGVFLEKLENQKNELKQSAEELRRCLDLKMETAQAVTQVVLAEIQLSRDLSEKTYLELESKLDKSQNGILTELKGDLIGLKTMMSEKLGAVELASKSIEDNHTALMAKLSQQNSALTAEVVSSKSKLNHLIITASTFSVLMLIYVGYDIWGNIN